jgi:hypothetical protein
MQVDSSASQWCAADVIVSCLDLLKMTKISQLAWLFWPGLWSCYRSYVHHPRTAGIGSTGNVEACTRTWELNCDAFCPKLVKPSQQSKLGTLYSLDTDLFFDAGYCHTYEVLHICARLTVPVVTSGQLGGIVDVLTQSESMVKRKILKAELRRYIRDTPFTRDEVQRLWNRFNQMDNDGRGQLNYQVTCQAIFCACGL